jgi:cytochrome c5
LKQGLAIRTYVVLLATLAPACDDHVIGQGAPIVSSCLRDPPLTYENFGAALLDRHCNSCHSEDVRQDQRGGAPIGVDFDDWDLVLAWAERINARAVVDTSMPPSGGTLLKYERDQLAEWMRCEVLPSVGQLEQDRDEPEEDGS